METPLISNVDDLNCDSTDSFFIKPSVEHDRTKRRILMFLFAYAAALGAIVCFLPEDGDVLEFIVGLPLLILGIWWCHTDAAQHAFEIGRFTRLLLFLVFFLGLLLYFFQTRGIRGVFPLAYSILLVGALWLCMFVTQIATLYMGDAAGLWDFQY